MSDIDRLRELGRLVEEEARGRVSVPGVLTRRVRLRQAATSGVAVFLLVAGAGLAWAGVRWIDRTTLGPADRGPSAGPVSPTPSGGVENGGIVADLEPVDADVGPGPLDPSPENEWRPPAEPAFLGGGRAFGAVWRMYAWRAPIGFVGWHDIETATGQHIESGGATELKSCRLVPQIAHLENKSTSENRKWLLYGYIAPEVASVDVNVGGRRFGATILRVPGSVGAPFDMYVLPVAGLAVTQQDAVALGTTIRDSGGDELDPGPLEHCLGLSPPSYPAVGVASPEETAATVAIAALTEAGLHDATGIYYDYGEVVDEEDGWAAYFCLSRPAVCSRDTADSSMRLAQDGVRIVVVAASGRFTDNQRDRLVGFESVGLPSPGEIYDPVAVPAGPLGGYLVTASVYWTGAIPSGLRSMCHVEALDERGRVVHRNDEFEHHAPSVEGARDGVFETELPEGIEASRARVVCGKWQPR